MKPRNKFQRQVVDLSKQLPRISKTQIQWAYKNCIEHYGRRTKKGVITCLECTHTWTDKTIEKHCICPQCGSKLVIADTRQRVFDQYEYFCIITAWKGFQVLRFFYITCDAKVGKKAIYRQLEVVQRWIAPDGKYATMARLRPTGYFVKSWCYGTDLEIRPEKNMYDVNPTCIYPRQKLIPEIQRSGYQKQFYGLTPFELFYCLLSYSKAETLLKAGQISLLELFSAGNRNIQKYWASIRICIRNRYIVNDALEWCDYIDMLRFFNRDVHNAKYVCPADLKDEHYKFVKKKRLWQKRIQEEEAKKRAFEEESTFKELKSKFFGVEFSDGLISIFVLDSVEKIKNEGDLMHHCVFSSNYHLKTDSLILSARINDERLETIEFSLSKLQVIQSRGLCNKITPYHDKILELVQKNIPLIKKRMVA